MILALEMPYTFFDSKYLIDKHKKSNLYYIYFSFILPTLVDVLNPVFNYGIGLEMPLNDKISVYARAASDYSGVISDITRFSELEEEASNSVFQADFLKFGGGFMLNTSWAEITLGATYTGASEELKRPINFSGDEPVSDSGEPTTLTFSKWRFILGFSFPFAEKIQKDLEVGP